MQYFSYELSKYLSSFLFYISPFNSYICVGLPVFSRDLLFHAYGADCMQEYGKVVILGNSVEEKEYTTKEVPWRAEGWLHKRMSIKELEAIVEAISPTAAKVGFITFSL